MPFWTSTMHDWLCLSLRLRNQLAGRVYFVALKLERILHWSNSSFVTQLLCLLRVIVYGRVMTHLAFVTSLIAFSWKFLTLYKESICILLLSERCCSSLMTFLSSLKMALRNEWRRLLSILSSLNCISLGRWLMVLNNRTAMSASLVRGHLMIWMTWITTVPTNNAILNKMIFCIDLAHIHVWTILNVRSHIMLTRKHVTTSSIAWVTFRTLTTLLALAHVSAIW